LQIIESARADADNYSSRVQLFANSVVGSCQFCPHFYKKREFKPVKLMVMMLLQKERDAP